MVILTEVSRHRCRHYDLFFSVIDVVNLKIVLTMVKYWEKAMASHSSTLAWKIPWEEEPGRLQSMRSLGVGHD